MPSQIEQAETNPIAGWGSATVTKIRPSVDIHNIMTIDPGLIRIRMAYGYMKADDVAAARAQVTTGEGYGALADHWDILRRTTEITLLRKQIWVDEFATNGLEYHESSDGTLQPPTTLPGGPNLQTLESVRTNKRLLKTLVSYRKTNGGALPSIPTPPERWWLDWEAHSWAPTVVLWDAQHPFEPPKPMACSFSPQGPFTRGQQVSLTVRALDSSNSSGPDLAANVLLDGKIVGTTGSVPIPMMLAWHSETEPGNGHLIKIQLPPDVVVAKDGYQPQGLPLKFS